MTDEDFNELAVSALVTFLVSLACREIDDTHEKMTKKVEAEIDAYLENENADRKLYLVKGERAE